MSEASWQNRIVGYGEVDPGQLVANPKNWRVHPQHQQAALKGNLEGVGWVQTVLVNQRTGFVVDGHARVALALRHEQPTVPVLWVDLSEQEEAQILATLDPIAAMAATDSAQLDALLAEIQTEDEGVTALLADLAASLAPIEDARAAPLDPGYSRAVESPVYEIRGDNPPLHDLVDESRADDLLARIDASDAPEDVRRFLRLAAHRHLKFDYAKIAEFYAHAEPEVQDLMERSALVIIDVDQAIEYGFARLANELREISAADAEALEDDDAAAAA